jgi:hypothetical protein
MTVEGGSSSILAEVSLCRANVMKRRNEDVEDVRDGAMIEPQ